MTLTNRWGLILEGAIAVLLIGVLAVLVFAIFLGGANMLLAPARTGMSAQPAAQSVEVTQPMTTTQAISAPQQTIVVVGSGTVAVKPNLARVEAGVETLAPTVAQAAEENDQQMAAVIAKIKELGIAANDIQTTYYSVSPERSYEPSGPGPITGYRVATNVQITIRDVQQISTVIDGVAQAGANNIYGMYFGLDPQTQQQAQEAARSKAVADVQARAAALAKLNGVEMGKLLSISEVIGTSPYPVMKGTSGGGEQGGAPVEPGMFEITMQLQGTYAAQ